MNPVKLRKSLENSGFLTIKEVLSVNGMEISLM